MGLLIFYNPKGFEFDFHDMYGIIYSKFNLLMDAFGYTDNTLNVYL